MRSILYAFIFFFITGIAAAEWSGAGDEEEFFRLERATLEDILDIKTSVASRTDKPLRRTPGLVTVITREEIQTSGARDLADVLSLVPELDFAADVQGNIGLGVRGIWANEGKALLIWDGQIFNDILYSTFQADRFPADQIEEIEIIKGPGSVLYGGFSELAVINIRTRAPRELNGSSFYAAHGQGSAARARTYAGYSFGTETGGVGLSAKVFWEDARRSDRRYTDLSGSSYGMASNSALRPRMLNLFASGETTSLRLILDGFSLRERDHFDAALSTGSTKVGYPALFAEVRRRLRAGEDTYLEPRITYTESKAWLEEDEYFYYDKAAQRITAGLNVVHKAPPGLELLGGAEYFNDRVRVGADTTESARYISGKTKVSYYDLALFGQADLTAGIFGFTAGGRYEKHSNYGSALVPRLAVTGKAGKANFKAIYSQAFRAPSIENMRLNPDIDPERSYSGEFEAGYKASDTLFFSGSLFQTIIKDPIVYGYTGSSETYTNYDRTGTRGFGLNLKFKAKRLRADLGYLYYAATQNRVASYAVPGHGSYLLGFPRHKITLNSHIPLSERVGMNPSAVYISRRYGLDAAGSARCFGEKVTANLNFHLKDIPLARLTLDIGIRDIFQSNLSYIQPYDGGHSDLPAPSRELFLKASFGF